MIPKRRLLCLSGSLRKASYNKALIQAACILAPSEVELVIFEGMGQLPLFNPDLETDLPTTVRELRHAVRLSDGLLIASPEYAHGISSVLKNALDWLVSGDEFPSKPVSIFNTSPRATHAQAALREVIKTMSGIVIEEASIAVPLLGSHYRVQEIVSDPDISNLLQQAIRAFIDAIDRCELNR
ncbi:MAG: NAD(P)H-dependent oxidoreductase [Gammaproteobacteria bacterium]|nr:NAD(P)H-dependent oxidoreductase [Gammaproteobacteria bacterium]